MSENYSFHPNAKKVWKKEKLPTASELSQEILQGNRYALAKAITLLESSNSSQLKIGKQVLSSLFPHSGKSIRIGITGAPGVGKSTFIEALGMYLIQHLNKKVAVLAIDPSSSITKGSILGDKTRMKLLSAQKNAFIRPSANQAVFGGVSLRTSENIVLCEACGFDVILVETVGVGQSEYEVFNLVDFFLLLIVSNTGDELQGIKRGIVEMAHAILVNKADGEGNSEAKLTQAKFGNALEYLQPIVDRWETKVGICSSLENKGISDFWAIVESYVHVLGEDKFQEYRKNQSLKRFQSLLNELIVSNFWSDKNRRTFYRKIELKVKQGIISPEDALLKFKQIK